MLAAEAQDLETQVVRVLREVKAVQLEERVERVEEVGAMSSLPGPPATLKRLEASSRHPSIGLHIAHSR